MPGPFDLLAAFQRLNPGQMQQPNPGGNVRSGAPGAAVSSQLPPGAPAPPIPAGAGSPPAASPGPGNAPPGGPPPQQQQPPQPVAYQTPQNSDLGQMYLQLVQQQNAKEGFWRGLAGMDAALYPGRQRGQAQMIAGIGQPTDTASNMFNNMMRLQGFSQEQQALQNFYKAAPDIAQQLHMTPQEVIAYGPDAIKLAAAAQQPPEAMRNWNYAKNQFVASHPEMSPAEASAAFEQQYPMGMAVLGGMPGMTDTSRQMTMDQIKFKNANPGAQLPSWLQDSNRYNAYNKDLSESQSNFDAFNKQAQVGIGLINQLKSDPETLGKALNWMNTRGKLISPETARALPAMAPGSLDENTYRAVETIDQLGGQVYSEGFKATGSRRTQQEVNAIVEGLSQLKSTGYGADAYIKNALNPVLEHIQKGMANNYGAAQQLDQTPDDLKSMVGKIYLPGGDLYGGQGGQWAKDPNLGVQKSPASSSTQQAAPIGQKMSEADISAAKANIAKYGRDYVIQFLQKKGYDTSGL